MRPRLSFLILVVNGEPFVRYCIESLYPHAHQILVVEGAVARFHHAATADGHSTDRTVEIIRSFPDPEHKIRLIQREGFWEEKDAMCNAPLDLCDGDYLWQIDIDEFYQPDAIEATRRYLARNPDVTCVHVQTINFWRGFHSVMKGGPYVHGADEFARIFRYEKGYRFASHRPPTIVNESGKTPTGRLVGAAEFQRETGVVMYHYSYVFERQVAEKAEYYAKMGWGQGCEDGLRWVRDVWSGLGNPLRVHLIDHPPSWVEPFRGSHPPVIQRLIADTGPPQDPELQLFLRSRWELYAKAGRALARLAQMPGRTRTENLRRFFKALQTLHPSFTARACRANWTILKCAWRYLTERTGKGANPSGSCG